MGRPMRPSDLDTASLPKLCNEALILSALLKGPRHGYQIAIELETRSAGMFPFNHGTLYPILHKLEKMGFIRGTWKQEEGVRKRKYYTLTKSGKTYLDTLNRDLKTLFHTLFRITEGEQ